MTFRTVALDAANGAWVTGVLVAACRFIDRQRVLVGGRRTGANNRRYGPLGDIGSLIISIKGEPRHRVKNAGAGLRAAGLRAYGSAFAPDSTAPLLRCQRQLLWYRHKQRASQFAVSTDERRVVGFVVFTKEGRWPGVGVFFRQGFVSRATLVKFCIDGGFLFVRHQGRVGSNKVLPVIRKDGRFEFGFRP